MKNKSQKLTLPATGFLRLKDVLTFIPIGRPSWYAGIKSGKYPKPIKFGQRTALYRVEDIEALIAEISSAEPGWAEAKGQ